VSRALAARGRTQRRRIASAAGFGHGGANLGYRCFMWAHLGDDFGVVIMTNGENGSELLSPLIQAIERAYGPVLMP
jgi:hypothetical protein